MTNEEFKAKLRSLNYRELYNELGYDLETMFKLSMYNEIMYLLEQVDFNYANDLNGKVMKSRWNMLKEDGDLLDQYIQLAYQLWINSDNYLFGYAYGTAVYFAIEEMDTFDPYKVSEVLDYGVECLYNSGLYL